MDSAFAKRSPSVQPFTVSVLGSNNEPRDGTVSVWPGWRRGVGRSTHSPSANSRNVMVVFVSFVATMAASSPRSSNIPDSLAYQLMAAMRATRIARMIPRHEVPLHAA
jgi:hypothetical protein